MKKLIILTFVLFILSGSIAFASEFTGVLNTGVQTGLQGTVVVPPSASPADGTYTTAQSISLVAAGSNSIHYVLDSNSISCTTGIVYSTPISFSASTLISAISCYPNGASSSVANFAYVIQSAQVQIVTGGGGGGGGGSSSPSSPLGKVDTNKDGKVDILDFNTLMVHWGETGSGNIADFNNDGKVDIFDFNLLMVNWTI